MAAVAAAVAVEDQLVGIQAQEPEDVLARFRLDSKLYPVLPIWVVSAT